LLVLKKTGNKIMNKNKKRETELGIERPLNVSTRRWGGSAAQ
jgi:hypothetical protein